MGPYAARNRWACPGDLNLGKGWVGWLNKLTTPLQAHTPTMNGFGRFLGEAIGLQAGSPGEGPEVTGRVQEGRERR